MLKKTIFILTLFSGNVIAATVELGFENEQYNYAYRSADVFMPYIKSNFNPVTDSALNVSLTYMYQDQYGKKHKKTSEDRFKTNRDRIELYLKGYTLNRGAYSFSPSAGFRYESWDVNYDNPKKQDKWKLELRFYPNMTYKLNDQLSLYMNGFVAPVFFKTQQESRKDNNYVKGKLGAKRYNNDYYQELQILGVRYKFNNDNTLWASVYNERKYNQHSSKYDRWQLRGGYDFKVTEEFVLSPFIRYDLSYREKNLESTSNNGLSKNNKEIRNGASFSYKIIPSVKLVGEIYRQTTNIENYYGEHSEDKNRMFYKLGINKTF